jgi:hypothetical protein
MPEASAVITKCGRPDRKNSRNRSMVCAMETWSTWTPKMVTWGRDETDPCSTIRTAILPSAENSTRLVVVLRLRYWHNGLVRRQSGRPMGFSSIPKDLKIEEERIYAH